MAPLLQVQDLHVAYISRAGQKSPALAGVSFDVQPGETLGVLGESGSGKSTLAAALLRLLPGNGEIQKGVVLFEGQELLRAESRALERVRGARIALIFQEPSLALHPTIRIGEQIGDALLAHQSLSRGALRDKTLQLLTEVFPADSARLADSYPHQLSGGQQQRVLIAHPRRSLDKARALLKEAGFTWTAVTDGEATLIDSGAKAVEFSILTSSTNADRTKMATLIQDDLKQLGMRVQVVPMEFRSLIDRVTQTKEYEACVLGLVSFDADPTPDLNVWLSSGGTHLWNPSQPRAATAWEAEIDKLMEQQLAAPSYEQRKKSFDRVQQILAENQPMIFLASPDILAGAKNSIW